MVSITDNQPMIGRQLFDVITSGMYDNPLMIFREYVQNSADSIDLAVSQGALIMKDARISIELHGNDRSITIQDNGLGLSNGEAHFILKSLGCSPKEGTTQRGFRGIGRLGGLAYCSELKFETRASINEDVAVISWDRLAIEKLAAETDRFVSLMETVEKVSMVSLRPANDNDLDHFFKVTLINVKRFHADVLMNVKVVTDYLAQVAPVSYREEHFQWAPLIYEYLAKVSDFRCYEISVNNRKVMRPYFNSFAINTKLSDRVDNIEFFTFNGVDNTPIALGWYAKTNFYGSITTQQNISGIRIRLGNIEVGGQQFLDSMYSERRFAGWQIGEIHILNNRLKPNARRDDFEQSPDYELFIEQTAFLCRHLSALCRKSSTQRFAHIRVENTLNEIEYLFGGTSIFLDEKHYELAINRAQVTLKKIQSMSNNNVPYELKKKYYELKDKIEKRDDNPVYLTTYLDETMMLNHFNQKTLFTHIAKSIIDSYDKSNSAEEILNMIVTDFSLSK